MSAGHGDSRGGERSGEIWAFPYDAPRVETVQPRGNETPDPQNDTYYHAHIMAKTRITVTVEQDLVSQARSLGVSLSAACERGLAEVTEIAVARAELARQVAEFEANGGIYDDRELARARRVLAEVDAPHQVNRIAG